MSETIKAVITADASGFEAAIAKAAASATKFEAKMNARKIGMPSLELSPQMLKQMDQAAARMGDLQRQASAAGGGAKNGALGFLAFSQAVEDAQYGIRGVLNNIPQMVMGFGAGAGVAGVLSLAAVAAVSAYSAINKLAGLAEAEQWAKASTKATEEFTAALEKNAEKTKDLAAAQASASDRAFRQNTADIGIGRDLSAQDLLRSIEAKEEAIARARRLQDQIMSANQPMATSGEGARDQGVREWQIAGIKYTLEQKRATEDLAASQEKLNQLAARYQKIQEAQNQSLSENQAARSTAAAEAERLRQLIAAKEAEKARSAQLADDAPDGSNLQKSHQKEADRIQGQISEAKRLMDQMNEEVKLREELIQKILQEGNAAKTAIDQKAAAVRAERDNLRDQIKSREALAQAEAKAIQFRALQGQFTELKQKADEAPAQTAAANDFADDLQLAGAALTLGKQKTDELTKQLQLQREAKDLAAKTGMSEAESLRLVKERAAALEKAAKLPTGTIKERAQQRADERAEERQRKRDEAVQEAARKREERKREREKDKLDPEKENDLQRDAERVRRQAAEREKKANADLNKNLENQTKIQEEIKALFKNIAAA